MYEKKLIKQWFAERSVPRLWKAYRFLGIRDALQRNRRCIREDPEYRAWRDRRRYGLREPLYSMIQPLSYTVHPISGVGDTLAEMANRLIIW